MDFGQGDGGFGAGERAMSSFLNELGEHRQRNNNNNGGLLSNPLKPCRSASEMEFCNKSRDGDDHVRSGEGQGPMKFARTDSFPFDLKMHSHHQQQQLLRNNNGSIASEGRLGYSPANSGDGGVLFKNDPLSVGLYGDSVRTANGGGHGLLHPYYSFKPAGGGGGALSLPLSIGRAAEATLNNNTMGMIHGTSSRFCFTALQWQELEHQALIFKYMMAGVQVPPELLSPIRKSVAELNTFAALSAPGSLHHHPTMGWSSFNLRFANNTDPEPGRCRRTDGKKWRCARDVAPDQKYCERHMHRGRPRSRKLVEAQSAMNTNSSNNNNSTTNPTTTQAIGGTNSSSSATSSVGPAAGRSSSGSTFTNLRPPFSMAQTNGSSTLGVKAFSGYGNVGGGVSINGASVSQFNKPPLQMVSAALPNKDYRYMNWMKGDMDEQMLFSDAKGLNGQDSQSLAMLNNAWRLMPSKVADPKVNVNATNTNNNNSNNSSFMQYTSSQLRTLLPQDFGLMSETNQMNLTMQDHQQQQHQQHSFLSPGFGAVDSVNVGRDQSSEGQPLRHFFDDWPRNNRDPSTLSWSDMEERSNSSSNTQLSISLPMTITDFPGTNSSSPRGKLSLSSLKLSMSARSGATEDDPLGVDATQMGLGVGLGLMNEDRHRHTNNNSWIPVTWQSPVGGPLAEVLQSSTNGGGIPSRGCKTSSGLNLMSDGWGLSPHGSPRMASPTGVLQKTFASLSDSSSGSSPRAVAAAAAAAKHETSLQHTIGGV